MNKNWLWDINFTTAQAKNILGRPKHKDFLAVASLLFSRNNDPRVVFGQYIGPLLFCRQWSQIKKRMSKDKWNTQRIIFWQAVFEKLKEKYQRKGVVLREKKEKIRDDICKEIGAQIRNVRQKEGFSQQELADKLRVSQQIISRIESGGENISLITLKNILEVFGKKFNLKFNKEGE